MRHRSWQGLLQKYFDQNQTDVLHLSFKKQSSLLVLNIRIFQKHSSLIVLNIRIFQIKRDDLEKKALNLKVVTNNDYHYMLYDVQIYKSIDIRRTLMTCW